MELPYSDDKRVGFLPQGFSAAVLLMEISRSGALLNAALMHNLLTPLSIRGGYYTSVFSILRLRGEFLIHLKEES